jgi:hypothetical protein
MGHIKIMNEANPFFLFFIFFAISTITFSKLCKNVYSGIYKSAHQHLSVTNRFEASCGFWEYSVRVRVTLKLTVCQSVRLGVEPTLGLVTRC